MLPLLTFALLIFCGHNTHGINPSSEAFVEVKEIWPTNELVFTWNQEYFKQFFKPNAKIMLQVTAFISETNEATYTASMVGVLREVNGGTAKIAISSANKEKISKFSHYYVLQPVGTQSNIYLSSAVIRSTPEDGQIVEISNFLAASGLWKLEESTFQTKHFQSRNAGSEVHGVSEKQATRPYSELRIY